jgi:phosphate transport system permease protein
MGETMAVFILIGGNDKLNFSLLNTAGTLASLLASKFQEAEDPDEIAVLMYAAVVLMATTLLVNILGAYVLKVAQAKVKGLI